VEDYENGLADFDRRNKEFKAIVAAGDEKYYPADPGNRAFEQGWAAPGANLADWGRMAVPGYWNLKGLDINGVVWFRREVEIPQAWAGKDLQLQLGACDKTISRISTTQRSAPRAARSPKPHLVQRDYSVPGSLVKPGVQRDRRPHLLLGL